MLPKTLYGFTVVAFLARSAILVTMDATKGDKMVARKVQSARIYPKLSNSRKFNKIKNVSGILGRFPQLLYLMMLPHATVAGDIDADPAKIKEMCCPYFDEPVEIFKVSIEILEIVGLVARIDANTLRINKYEKYNGKVSRAYNFAQYSPEFDSFWEAYPRNRRVCKAYAYKIFSRIPNICEILPIILKALEWQKRTSAWTKDGGQYIPYPSTYLTQQRYLDEQPMEVLRATSTLAF